VTADRQAERDAIQAAASRLLAGTPTRSTGALTVLQLAAEAGVKRWVLTHKHPDLRQAFEEQRRATDHVPLAFQNLSSKIADLEAANRRLRADNTELAERVNTYAQVIRELSTEIDSLRTQTAIPDNVRLLHTRLGTPPTTR
jgi:septal ring factor EnvC (AmiA/AmiB activator)